MLNSSPTFYNYPITQGMEGLGRSLLGLSLQGVRYLSSFGLPRGEWKQPLEAANEENSGYLAISLLTTVISEKSPLNIT